jgi:hypothetical protein
MTNYSCCTRGLATGDAGAADLVISIGSPPSERQRTLDLITQAANDA